ncbi:DUF2164 domain-containing protein [Francisellaceae bacterium]|nr:DUF2164 domain-containing protein [Francisellaceae bacterium]
MKVEISKEDKEAVIQKIKAYIKSELEVEIGGFEAEFLLEFFQKEVGPFIYNQALSDMQSQIEYHHELLKDAVYNLEKD